MMAFEKAENFEEEFGLLLKLLKPNIFRFVIVQNNHLQIIEEVEERISSKYPKRKISRIKVENKDYRQLMDAITSQNNGCLIIEDFHEILSKPDVYIGFNQRRDKIAQFPIALICFIPTGNEVLQKFLKKIPDFWSFRNLVISLEVSGTVTQQQSQKVNNVQSTIGGGNVQEKEKELNRLKKRIDELKPNSENISLLNSLYPELFKLLEDLAAYKEGLEYAERYLEINRKLNEADESPKELAIAYNYKASFLEALGKYEEAKDDIEKALSLGEKSQDSDLILDYKNNLGHVLTQLGQYDLAKIILESVLEMDIAKYGQNHIKVADSKANLALVFQQLNDFEKAANLLEEAISNTNTKADLNITSKWESNLAIVYRALGKNEKAAQLLEKSLQSDLSYYKEDHPEVTSKKSNLALVYMNMGHFNKAEALMSSALKADLKTFGKDHPNVALRYLNFAGIYYNSGRYLEAKENFLKAYFIFFKVLGETHPDTINAKTCLDKVNKALS